MILNQSYLLDGLTAEHRISFEYLRNGLVKRKYYKNLSNTSYDFVEQFEYDDFGRIVKTSSGKNTSNLTQDSEYNYDALGQLKRKRLGVNNNGITPDNIIYQYDIQGRTVAQVSNNFRYGLTYNDRGDITRQQWSNQMDNPLFVNQYDYYYDNMKRLVGANYSGLTTTNNIFSGYSDIANDDFDDFNCTTTYFKGGGSITTCEINSSSTANQTLIETPQSPTYLTGNKYDGQYYYSKSGNIDLLKRFDQNSQYVQQSYVYQNNNLLQSISFYDGTTTTGGGFTYDKDGNLTSDLPTANVSNISYDPFNMPQSLTNNNGTISYRYDVSDRRSVKILTDGTKEFYIGGVVVDQNNKPKQYSINSGYVTLTSGNNLAKNFLITDWLGTVRQTTAQDGTVVSSRDHYPYGKLIPGRHFVSGDPESERYQFTGHEYDVESTYGYHGARYYNRELGRYMSLDPMAAEFPSHSDYNYVLGNPISFIDPTGKFPIKKGGGGNNLAPSGPGMTGDSQVRLRGPQFGLLAINRAMETNIRQSEDYSIKFGINSKNNGELAGSTNLGAWCQSCQDENGNNYWYDNTNPNEGTYHTIRDHLRTNFFLIQPTVNLNIPNGAGGTINVPGNVYNIRAKTRIRVLDSGVGQASFITQAVAVGAPMGQIYVIDENNNVQRTITFRNEVDPLTGAAYFATPNFDLGPNEELFVPGIVMPQAVQGSTHGDPATRPGGMTPVIIGYTTKN